MKHVLVAAALVLLSRMPAEPRQVPAAPPAALKVTAVKFEPMKQGRNVLRVTVANSTARPEMFAIGIGTRSPDYGRGIGWGTQFTATIGAGETKETRFVYWVHGPITDKTAIFLSFYNPPTEDKIERRFLLERREYSGAEVAHAAGARAEPLAHATDAQRTEVVALLRQTQQAFNAKRYGEAWRSFSKDLCAVDFCQTEADFIKNYAADNSPLRPYLWPVDRFLAFEPSDARLGDDGRVLLRGAARDPELRVYFVREDGGWKIDEIAGYVSQAATWVTWEQRVLPGMETRQTGHFELFYEKGSTAAKEADRIATERESGYKAISDLFGIAPDVRVRLVLFEDPATKYAETGHQGAGWAYGTTIVEVFNPTQHLDPFHELCHILSDRLGDPPALFNEGTAVYVSERLGAAALSQLGGGTARLDERVRTVRTGNEFIPLERLLRFTEIGSEESKPAVAYAEAGSFVKFLIERFGREKFLAAYKSLKNSDDAKVQDENIAALTRIYGMSLAEMEARWIKGL